MNIGDVVTISKRLAEAGEHKTWIAIDIEPVEVVYLGTGQRWNGKWEHAGNEYDGDIETYWMNTKCHNVLICQPVDQGGRYRKPIAVPKDGVQDEHKRGAQ